jgi:hypothetical protein
MAAISPRGVVRVCVAVVGAVLVTVAVTGAVPSAPSNLAAQVVGATVTLSWTPPAVGPVIGYRLEAGSASGLSNLANTSLGVSPLLTATAVPNGTYYVRVRAIGVDGESSPSNEVVVTVPGGSGCAAVPNPPVSVAASVAGMIVSLSWATGGGCPTASFVVHAGSAPGLSNIAIVHAGALVGLSASAPAGTYYVRVHAQNAFGTSAPSNEIAVVVGGSAAIACDPAAYPNAARWPATAGGNNHLYEFINVGRDITWDEARAVSAATGPGWHLATVTSFAENSFIESLFAGNRAAFNCCLSSNASGPWMGGFASTFRSNDWRWITGEPFLYSDWGPAEPFGNGDRLSYAEFGAARFLAWNDVPSVYPLSPRGYIRECSPELAR